MARPFVAGGGIQSESISDFDPRTLGTCTVWLDAADSNTLFTDTAATVLATNGDRVLRWNDKSGNGHNATTTNISLNQPNAGALLVRDSNTNLSRLRFGSQIGVITATTAATGISFTGTLTNGQNTISTIASITPPGSIVVGMAITNANIPTGTFIASYNSGDATATMSNTAIGTGTLQSITGVTNTVTATLPIQPIVGQSLVIESGTFGGLTGSQQTFYHIRFVSYTGTTATLVLATTRELTTTQTVTTTTGENRSITLGHANYTLPTASVPTGQTNSTHFIVFRGAHSNNGHPVAIGSYASGGLREFLMSSNATRVLTTNNGAPFEATTTSTARITILSGMFSNSIMSGWNNGTPFTTNNIDLQLVPTTFNTGTVANATLLGSRANTFPAYGDFFEYIQFNRALQNDERQQVEGYLAWKWGLVQTLPVTHPYYYAKAAQTGFQPNSFPSCALWLDAADSNGFTRLVDSWTDKSPAGNTVSKTGITTSPSYGPNRNISFTVGGQGLQRTVTSINTTSFTVFTTFLLRSHTNSARLFSLATTDDNQNDVNGFSIQLNYRNGGGIFVSRALPGAGLQAAIEIPTASVPFNTVHTVCVTITGAAGTNGTVFLNGTSAGTFNAGTNNLNPSTLSIGLSPGGGSGFSTGDIYETIFHSSVLTTNQRRNVEGYLAWKWGTVAKLPSGHPNLTAAPLNFTPTSITGCQLWLDAADSATVVGTGISRVLDKSGNYTNLGDAVGFTRSSTFNTSYPSFFNDVSTGTRSLGRNTAFSATNPMTVFAVLQSQATSTSTPYVFNTASGSTRTYIYINGSTSTTNARVSAGGSNAENTGSGINLSTAQVLSASFGASSTTLFTNGTAGTAVTITGGATLGITVGGNSGDAAGGWMGHLSEFIIFSLALTAGQRQQVEGYLAWKWNLQGNLPDTHPFRAANYFFNNTRPFSRYFNPPDIDGCQLWLDAADQSTLFTDTAGNNLAVSGNAVARWNDKSGLGNNVTKESSTVRYSTTLNSRSVLSFPSSGTLAGNILSTSSLTRDGANFSAFYVCRYPSGTPHPIQVVNFDLSTSTATTITGIPTTGATPVFEVSSSDGFRVGRYVIISGVTPSAYNQTGVISAIPNSTRITVELSVTSPTPGAYSSGGTITQLTASQMFGHDGRSDTNFNIQNVNYEGGTASRARSSVTYATAPTLASNTFILGCVRQNGVFTLSTNGVTHTTPTSTPTGLTAVGNKTSGAYSIFGGLQGLDIGEVIIYNAALHIAERQTIEGYLAWKWGIQRATSSTNPSVSTSGTSLAYPTTHPYYNFPPIDVTPMTPALRLYKKQFDPADLSPVIWIDPQDSTAVTRDATTNRVTQIVNKGSFAGNFTPPSGILGPLATRSAIGNGTGVDFLDYSSGGHYQVTSATMEDATTMALTVYPAHNGNIPETTGFVIFTPTRGTYSDGASATTSVGPFAISTATISAADNRTMTVTTVNSHGIGNSQSVYLTINTGTFSGASDASGLTGLYTTHTSGNTGTTITIVFGTNQTAGLMTITDGHVRNNVGTAGPYITKTGTTGSTIKITTYGNRALGNLNDFMGRIEYGSIPIGSGEIGTSSVTLSSVTSSVFTASDVTGITIGTPLIPGSTVGALTSGVMYYVTSLSGVTFRLATTLANALAASPVTVSMTDNASLNLATTCYGTHITLRTPIDHAIASNQQVNLNLNAGFWLPYQTGAVTQSATDPTLLNPSMIQFKTASITSNTILRIDLSTMPTGTQNPSFAIMSGVPTYISRGTFTINFPVGATFGDSTSAENVTITGLTTSSSTANNNATKLEFTIPSRPSGNITFSGLPGIIYCTSNFGTANSVNLNYITTSTSVSGNSITCPTPTTYPGTSGTVIHNIGRLLRNYGTSSDANSSSSSIYYPINGRAIENKALSSSLNSSTQTIVWVSHLTTAPNRWGRIGTPVQPPVIAAATTADGVSGGADGTSYAIRLAAFANAPRHSVRYSDNAPANFNSTQFFTDAQNPFRVNSVYFNLTASAVGDCSAYSRGESLGGYRYDSAFYNFNAQSGPTRITPLASQATLSIAHLRIGGDTSVGSTYSTTTNQLNGHWYEGGTGDILIFNRILPTEERLLLEGFLAQKYRTTGSVGGSALVLNASATYNITGSAAITGSSPNFTITVTGTFTTAFVVGSRVTISGVTTNTGLNNSWTVVSCNTTTLTFLSPTNTLMLWASGNGGTVAGNTASASGNSINPYRLNPTTITGQQLLSLTSTTAPYAQNLVAWFDAANPNLINNTDITTQSNATPPANEAAVTRWAPVSGWWANTPLQLANPSGTVTYYSSRSTNGLPGVYIGGTTSRLSLAATGSFSQYTTITNNNNFTWMIVFRPDTDPASSTTPVISVTSGTLNRLMLCSDGTFIYSDGTTSQTLTPSTVLNDGKIHMITVYRDGTTLGYRIVSENTNIGSGGFLTGTSTVANLKIPTFSDPTLTFGAIGVTGFTDSFKGTIFEAALFRSAMSLQSMQQVGGYLAHKWGLQASLPTSHGYKKIPA